MYALAYNLVRVAMCEAAGRQGVMAERISFVDATVAAWGRGGRGDAGVGGQPVGPGRYEPRVRKRRPMQYPLMKKPRAELRKLLREKDLAA